MMEHWTRDEMLLSALKELPQHFSRAIACDWMDVAAALEDASSLFILGRGPSAAIANEAALKFKETSGMHAEAYSAAEVMHGPMALVGKGFPVLALAARDKSEASMIDAANQLADKGGAVFVNAGTGRRAGVKVGEQHCELVDTSVVDLAGVEQPVEHPVRRQPDHLD